MQAISNFRLNSKLQNNIKNYMKNISIYSLIFFLVSFQLLTAQTKPESFYNYNFQQISKEEFDSISRQKGYLYNQYNLEDQIINILFQSKTRGKLKQEQLDSLKTQLNKIEPLKGEHIVIIYYPGKDKCNETKQNSTWNIFDRDYKKYIENLADSNQFWIYNNDDNLEYYYPRKYNWTKDENQYIEKLFFKMHYPCASSTVIDKDGNFISNLGEFGKQHVIQDIIELKK